MRRDLLILKSLADSLALLAPRFAGHGQRKAHAVESGGPDLASRDLRLHRFQRGRPVGVRLQAGEVGDALEMTLLPLAEETGLGGGPGRARGGDDLEAEVLQA